MSAYTTQGSSLVGAFSNIEISGRPEVALSALIFTIVFGLLMFNYRVGDYANRFFVILKFIFFAIAIVIMLLYQS